MDALIQYLVNRSRLEIHLVKLTEATQDSYVLTMECSVHGTGPVSSTLSSMTLDMTYEGKRYGQIVLPETKTSFRGTKVAIKGQRLQILDLEVYKAYVRSFILNEQTSFRLENGHCHFQSMGISSDVNYAMDVPIRGMKGLTAVLKSADVVQKGDDEGMTRLVFAVHNPSPVELDHGLCTFEMRNGAGELLVVLKGRLNMVRGTSEVELQGRFEKGKELIQHVKLLGVGVEEDNWCNETIQFIDIPVTIPSEFLGLHPGVS